MKERHRLRGKRDFARVRRSRGRVSSPGFVLYHSPRETPGLPNTGPRVGFAVSRRIGGAVVRNRVRRLLREAIRPLLPRLVACDVLIVVRPAALGAGVAELRSEFEAAAARAGLLQEDAGQDIAHGPPGR